MNSFKKTVGGIIFSSLCLTNCYGEIVFDWENSKIQKKEQRKIEEIVFVAANNFSNKYADLGPYNFMTSKERYAVKMEESDTPGEYWVGSNGGLIVLDVSLVNDYKKLERVAFHEFSHAYDHTKADDLEFNQGKINQAKELRVSSEDRAVKKTAEYSKTH